MKYFSIFIISCFLTNLSCAYKILGVFPVGAKSHYIIGQSLMKGLAEKGHEVTVISPYKESSPIANYRTVQVVDVFESIEAVNAKLLEMKDYGVVDGLTGFYDFGANLTRSTLSDKRVQDFMKTKQHFDLVICEVFLTDAMLGFGQLFNAPVVAVSSFSASIFTNDLVGNPSPLSYVPHPFSGFSTEMSLGQRIANILLTSVERGFYYNYFYPKQDTLFKEHFRESRSSLDEIRKNVSLILLNTHFSLAFPRPYVPNMIEIGGIQVNKKPKDLPKNIKDFIESADHGVIYFSLGSNMKSKSLPDETRAALIETFKNLKQKVLWKWEDPNLPGKPDNVLISDWFPQDDILAHPNVKLFITHGGLLSTTESIYHGKPLIGSTIDSFGNRHFLGGICNQAQRRRTPKEFRSRVEFYKVS
ncbi:UGT2A1.2 family protein [Megaselia abdita]